MRVIGGLRVGERKLFVYTPTRGLVPVVAKCILDFYVHEDLQCLGVGKALFQVNIPDLEPITFSNRPAFRSWRTWKYILAWFYILALF